MSSAQALPVLSGGPVEPARNETKYATRAVRTKNRHSCGWPRQIFQGYKHIIIARTDCRSLRR
jgi:hypothetical protein